MSDIRWIEAEVPANIKRENPEARVFVSDDGLAYIQLKKGDGEDIIGISTRVPNLLGGPQKLELILARAAHYFYGDRVVVNQWHDHIRSRGIYQWFLRLRQPMSETFTGSRSPLQ